MPNGLSSCRRSEAAEDGAKRRPEAVRRRSRRLDPLEVNAAVQPARPVSCPGRLTPVCQYLLDTPAVMRPLGRRCSADVVGWEAGIGTGCVVGGRAAVG